jgi:hypothetical protein
MKQYVAHYVDKRGDYQDIVVTGEDVRDAIANTLKLCPDCRRVIKCNPTPMWEDE